MEEAFLHQMCNVSSPLGLQRLVIVDKCLKVKAHKITAGSKARYCK